MKLAGLVPRLRFKGFDGEWEEQPLAKHIEEYREKATVQDEYEVLTSARSGLVRQKDYYENSRLTERENIGFNIIPPNYITYRSRSDDRQFFFNENSLGITGIISTYYPVFRIVAGCNHFFIEALSFYSNIVGKHSVGTSQTVLSLNELRKIRIPIPTEPEEQTKIAECLTSLDENITEATQKLEALKKHKRGLMQKMFPSEGQTVPEVRFKGFSGEWEEKMLGEVCEINPSTRNLPGNFVYIDLESVSMGHLKQKKIITRENAPSRAQRLLKKGDVIFQMVRPYQRNNYHFNLNDNIEYVASTGYAQLRAYESNSYLYQYLHNDRFVEKVLEKSTGSNYPAINSSDMSALLIKAPKPEEQTKIAECLSSLDELITAQSEKIEALKKHKKGMMQGLFPDHPGPAGHPSGGGE